MLASYFRILCCCCSSESYVIDERERLLQFQIPTMPWVFDDNTQITAYIPQAPDNPCAGTGLPTSHGQNRSKQGRARTIPCQDGLSWLTFLESRKMVDVCAQLPFNLHNRVIHDIIESRSRSQSTDYDASDEESYRSLVRQHNLTQKRAYELRYPVYYETSRSRSPSIGLGSTSIAYEADRPAAILNLRLVGVTETERGRTKARAIDSMSCDGGSSLNSTGTFHVKKSNPSVVCPVWLSRRTMRFHHY